MASRFAPVGSRGLSQYVRAGEYIGDQNYTEAQNEHVTVIIHIEGEQGVENIDAILNVDGIDVVFLGPYDLSQSLGIPGQVQDERVESMMAMVCERAAERRLIVGTYADDELWLGDGWIWASSTLRTRSTRQKSTMRSGSCTRASTSRKSQVSGPKLDATS